MLTFSISWTCKEKQMGKDSPFLTRSRSMPSPFTNAQWAAQHRCPSPPHRLPLVLSLEGWTIALVCLGQVRNLQGWHQKSPRQTRASWTSDSWTFLPVTNHSSCLSSNPSHPYRPWEGSPHPLPSNHRIWTNLRRALDAMRPLNISLSTLGFWSPHPIQIEPHTSISEWGSGVTLHSVILSSAHFG